VIEVNLLPGATRRPARRRPRLKLPRLSTRHGKLDRALAFAVVAWILGPAVVGWMLFSSHRTRAELALDLEQAARDSAHYATIIAANARLEARRDTVAKKLELIQEIDADRYVWPHIMDEISRALPDYTWLTTVAEVPDTSGSLPRVSIEGRTGNTLALTEFMKDLEASPFLHDVQLITTSMVVDQGKEVHSFTLQAKYASPPANAVQTVPLFKPED
jgi:Tfp pilus assembly protein PilN